MVNGRPLHGLVHPEMGHIHIPHDRVKDPFPGICPFHGDCLEGLASGPAIEARWGQPAESLPDSHPGWNLEAHYLALGVANFAVTLSPQRIILGGGVMGKIGLISKVRENFMDALSGYVVAPEVTDTAHHYIVQPALGDKAGVLGGAALAMEAEKNR